MRVQRLLTPAILLTTISLVAPMALFAQEDKGKPSDGMEHTWTIKYKKGDTYRIQGKGEFKINLSGNEVPVGITSTTRHEVKEVADNGDVTTIETTEDSKLNIAGQEINNPEPDRKATDVVNKSGIVVKRTVENSEQADSPLEKLTIIAGSFPLPPKPVKIGDSWKTEINNPLVEGKKVTMTSKLTGKEKIKDVETLVIKIEAMVPPSADAAEKDHVKLVTTYYVDPKASRLVRVKGMMENVPIDVQGMPAILSGEQEMDVLHGDKDAEKKGE